MVKVRGRRQGWGAIPVVVVVAVLAMMTGCPSNGAGNGGGDSEPETYTVTFEKQGGIGGSTGVTTTVGSPMPFATAPTKADAVFGGYYTGLNGTGTQYHTFGMASATNWDLPANTELIAYWFDVGGPGPDGGIVFYDKGSYSDGWRYLKAAPASTEWESKPWGGPGTEVGGDAQGQAIGTGVANTQAIVAEYWDEEPYDGRDDYAAILASDLSYGGYDDWFLPSEDELNEMYIHREAIGGFASTGYWSSSEASSLNAWAPGLRQWRSGRHQQELRGQGARCPGFVAIELFNYFY
jgi:hypothetical protein